MKKILALLLSLYAFPASAAVIISGTTDAGNEFIVIDGPIVDGDYNNFVKVFSQHPKAALVVLNSNGGVVYDGIKIGMLIRQSDLNTMIVNDGVCFSICAAIFFSGKQKFIQERSNLGVHSASDATGKRAEDINAMIGWYFGMLGYDLGLVQLWFSANPDSINSITAQINEDLKLGIISVK